MLNLLALLNLTVPAVQIEPGIYRYSGLAEALGKQLNAPVVCQESLGTRSAFVALRSRPFSAQAEILSEGLGVSFKANGNGWRIEENPDRQRQDRERIRRLNAVSRAQISAVLAEAKGLADRIAAERKQGGKKTGSAAESEALSLSGPRRQVGGMAIALARGEMPLDDLEAFAASFDIEALSLRQLVSSRTGLDEYMGASAAWRERYGPYHEMLARNARAGNTFDERLRAALSDIEVTMSIQFDPSSGKAWVTKAKRTLSSPNSSLASRMNLMPDFFAPSVQLSQLMSEAEWTGTEERVRATRKLVSDRPFTEPVRKPIAGRLSHAIWSWASQTGSDAVVEVSPYFDVPDVSGESATLSDLFRSRQLIPPPETEPRTGSRRGWSLLAPTPVWTGRTVDGALVLRNELSFLDRLDRGPATFSPAFERQVFEGRPPSIDALAREILALPWSRLASPFLSRPVTAYGHPANAVPFMWLYTNHAGFRKAVGAAADANVTFDLSGLSKRELAGFRDALAGGVPSSMPATTTTSRNDEHYPRTKAAIVLPDDCMVDVTRAETPAGVSLAFHLRSGASGTLWKANVGPVRLQP